MNLTDIISLSSVCYVGGRRPGGFGDRPSYDSGTAKNSYGGGRGDGYRAPSYGSYGSMLIFFTHLFCSRCFVILIES